LRNETIRADAQVVGLETRRTWIAVACTLICAPRTVHADGPGTGGVSLRWVAPESCPDAEVVRRRVVALAGPEVALSADAKISEGSGEFRVVLHVQVRGSLGERVLTAATCEAAAESVAVVLAMSAAPGLPAEPPAPPPMPPRLVEPPQPPPPPPAPSRAPRPALLRLSAEGSVDLGALPAPTAGTTLRVTVTPGRHVEAGIAGTLWLDRNGYVPGNPTQGAYFTLLTVDAFGCFGWRPSRRPFEVSPCALVELGRISATGFNETTHATSTALWIGVGLGARGRWELTRWLALAIEVDGVVPTQGQSFRVMGPGTAIQTVHATSVVAGRAHFGPEVRF